MIRRAKYFEIYFPDNEYQIYHDKTWREQELKRGEFHHQSPQISSRPALLAKLKSSAEELGLTRVTLHLSIYFLDMFLDNHNIANDRLHLVAFVALMIASKVEEKESKIPKIDDLNSIIARTESFIYPRSDFKALEKMMLEFLHFEVIVPTPATFCEYFITVVVTNEDKRHFLQDKNLLKQFQYFRNLRETARNLFLDFLDFSLLDCDVSQDVPSKVAAACICATRRQLKILPIWPVDVCKITKYTYNDIVNTMGRLTALGADSMDEKKCPKRKKGNRKSESGFFTDDSDVAEAELSSSKKMR